MVLWGTLFTPWITWKQKKWNTKDWLIMPEHSVNSMWMQDGNNLIDWAIPRNPVESVKKEHYTRNKYSTMPVRICNHINHIRIPSKRHSTIKSIYTGLPLGRHHKFQTKHETELTFKEPTCRYENFQYFDLHNYSPEQFNYPIVRKCRTGEPERNKKLKIHATPTSKTRTEQCVHSPPDPENIRHHF